MEDSAVPRSPLSTASYCVPLAEATGLPWESTSLPPLQQPAVSAQERPLPESSGEIIQLFPECYTEGASAASVDGRTLGASVRPEGVPRLIRRLQADRWWWEIAKVEVFLWCFTISLVYTAVFIQILLNLFFVRS